MVASKHLIHERKGTIMETAMKVFQVLESIAASATPLWIALAIVTRSQDKKLLGKFTWKHGICISLALLLTASFGQYVVSQMIAGEPIFTLALLTLVCASGVLVCFFCICFACMQLAKCSDSPNDGSEESAKKSAFDKIYKRIGIIFLVIIILGVTAIVSAKIGG